MGTLLFRHVLTSMEDEIVGIAAPIFSHKEVGHIQSYGEMEAGVSGNFMGPPGRHRLPTAGIPLNETDILFELLLLGVSQLYTIKLNHNGYKAECLFKGKWLSQHWSIKKCKLETTWGIICIMKHFAETELNLQALTCWVKKACCSIS